MRDGRVRRETGCWCGAAAGAAGARGQLLQGSGQLAPAASGVLGPGSPSLARGRVARGHARMHSACLSGAPVGMWRWAHQKVGAWWLHSGG
eukprot:1827135-Prymnesium_polylepis.1